MKKLPKRSGNLISCNRDNEEEYEKKLVKAFK